MCLEVCRHIVDLYGVNAHKTSQDINDMIIMYGNNAPGEGFRDVAVAVRGVGDCVLPWSCAEEQLE